MKRLAVLLVVFMAISWMVHAKVVQAQTVSSQVLLAELEEDDDEATIVPTEAENESEQESEDAPVNENEYEDVQPIVTTPEPTVTTPTTTVEATPTTNTESTNTSVEAAPVAPVISDTFPWAWTVIRAAGIASYAFLVLQVVTGVLLTTGVIYRLFSPAISWSIHRAVSTAMLFSVGVHIGSMLLDHFVNLNAVDVFVPFASTFRPTLMGLGTIGFYLLLIILGTSLYNMTSHPRLWRTLHVLGFPMFALIFIHGLLIGSDLQEGWLNYLYWVGGILVVAATGYRLIWKYQHPALKPQPQRA